jgi:hypothetical protein
MEQAVIVGNFPTFINDMIHETKSKKFRVGFIKKNGEYRVGKFDKVARSKFKTTEGTYTKLKGKGQTTNPEQYLCAFDLSKKSYRNINYKTMKWIAIGRKLFKINDLLANESVRITAVHKVKFSNLKRLMKENYEMEEK